MLSPIITTKVKGNFSCDASICFAMSYWGGSPVPLSPMTANFSESDAFGSGVCCAAWIGAAARGEREGLPRSGWRENDAAPQQVSARSAQRKAQRTRRTRIRMLTSIWRASREYALHVVGNDMGVRIEQDEVVADEPVFQFVGQLGQSLQDLRGNSREGNAVGIAGVHGQRGMLPFPPFLQDLLFELRSTLAPEDFTEELADDLLHRRRKQIALFRLRAVRLHQLLECALVLIELRRIRVLREVRKRILELLVQRDIVVHALLEIGDGGGVRIGALLHLRERGCGERGKQNPGNGDASDESHTSADATAAPASAAIIPELERDPEVLLAQQAHGFLQLVL